MLKLANRLKYFFICFVVKTFKIRKDESLIPEGPYCYSIDETKELTFGKVPIKICPYWKRLGEMDAVCLYLGERDEFLLGDQCKICNEKEFDSNQESLEA